jgi:hypothetical protein
MPKYDKHLIGARMITSILDMFEWITLANNQKSASERLRYLESFYTSFEQYKIQLRLCEERKRLIMSMDKKWWRYFYTKKGFNKIILKSKYKFNNIERRQYYVPS